MFKTGFDPEIVAVVKVGAPPSIVSITSSRAFFSELSVASRISTESAPTAVTGLSRYY